MKILIFPLFLILLPITLLFLTVKYCKKNKPLSVGLKIVFGIVFIIIGFGLSYFAIIISIKGHIEKGIQGATGVVTFIPISLFVNFIGIPLLLMLEKKIRGIE